VHAGDTYRSLESRTSWDEWADDYDYDRDEETSATESANRYVSAYSSVPNDQEVRDAYDAPSAAWRHDEGATHDIVRGPSRRRAVFSGAYLLVGGSLIEDLAILAWVGLTCYVALALFAVSQGFLYESSLPLRIPQDATHGVDRADLRRLRRAGSTRSFTTPTTTASGAVNRPLVTPWAKVGGVLERYFGGVAQLVERYVRNVEAVGSNPITSTHAGSATRSQELAWTPLQPSTLSSPTDRGTFYDQSSSLRLC
jgi:hypothetical protein